MVRGVTDSGECALDIVDDTPEEILERGGLGDFRLIIGPHPENEKPVIHRSNRPTNIPEGSLLHIQNKGNLIQIPPKKPFRANVAQLVLPEELDVETHVENDNVVPFPERLTGVDIPEKDRLREDFLEQMLMSIEMQS